MAKVTVTGGFSKMAAQVFEDELGAMLRLAGAEAVRSISGETRRGNQLINEAKKDKLKRLEDSSIANRRYLAKYNTTHDTFKEDRSNLTVTGQMIDALYFQQIGNEVRITVEASPRIPYKGKIGQNIAGASTNQEVALYNAENGRDFVQIDVDTLTRIRRLLTNYIRRILKTRFD